MSRIDQRSNTVGGDQAAGNIFKPTINIHPGAKTNIGLLLQKLNEEAAEDKILQQYIAGLEIFTRQVPNEVVVGIEEKMTAANRHDEITKALMLKEMIFSELKRNIFSPSFQTIYATLMGKLQELFEVYVKPEIDAGTANPLIDQLVYERVLAPVQNEIDSCGEPCNIVMPQHLRGMLYFLTGNCHIRWHKC
jgi:hypothetical protein